MAGRRVPDWTFEEMVQIRRHYPTGRACGCIAHLPGRSKAAIRMQALRMRSLGLLPPASAA